MTCFEHYKIIAKICAERLKKVLSGIIEEQIAFIAERFLTENICLTQLH